MIDNEAFEYSKTEIAMGWNKQDYSAEDGREYECTMLFWQNAQLRVKNSGGL